MAASLGGLADREVASGRHLDLPSDARLRSILETASDVILSVDRAGIILYANRATPPLTVEEVLGRSVYSFVGADERGRLAVVLEQVFGDGTSAQLELAGPTAGAETGGLWSVRVGPVFEGPVVVAATFCAMDITDQRRERERRELLLHRFERIGGHLPGVLFELKLRPDGTACFPYASAGMLELFRVRPEDVLEDSTPIFERVHPDDRAALGESMRASAAAMEPWSQEYRIELPHADRRWLYSTAVPERQPDGSMLWRGFVSDITERKMAERARDELEAQLRQAQKVESIGRLAGGVAHDFNNLLTSVLGFTELALGSVPPDSDAAQYLRTVLESAQRGAGLTQQLLAYARKKIVKPEVVNLNEVVMRMSHMIRRLMGESYELSLSLSPSVGMTKVDVGSFEQVLMNLAVNARDAMIGGGKLTLTTSNVVLGPEYCKAHPGTPPGRYVLLSASDTGCGMTKDVLARVFEPFFTTKGLGEGTGLGLSMCHGIVQQAGGNIAVESELGRGTTFMVYLPRVFGAQPEPALQSVKPPATGGAETILVVEDETVILQVARMVLSALGYRVLTAADGVEALQLVKNTEQPIHLLVTDVVMPKLGGADLAKALTELRPGLRVLYSSGYTDNAIADHGVLEEGVNFLQKPYTASDLASRVREVLDQDEA
jgi:PAS domain S-box-containing protein